MSAHTPGVMDQHASPMQQTQRKTKHLSLTAEKWSMDMRAQVAMGSAEMKLKQNEESVFAENETGIKVMKPNAAQPAMKRLPKIEQPTARWD